MFTRKRPISDTERELLIKELKVNPYRALNDAFALMAIIPILIFFYIIVTELFAFNALIGSIGLLASLAIVISIFGYLVTHDVINTMILYAYRLRRSDISREKLVAILSHELNNPLTAIRGNIELLVQGIHGNLTADQKKTLTLCYDLAERMSELTTDMLESALISTDTVKVTREQCDLSDIIDEQEKELAIRIEEKHLKLNTRRIGTTFTMWGSRVRLSQVIHNLLSNAVKYNHRGGNIDITLSSDGDTLTFSINNTGPYIPEEKMRSLFAKNEGSDLSVENSGLGLLIVNDIAAMHRGSVSAESNAENGTTFTVTFPRDLRTKIPAGTV